MRILHSFWSKPFLKTQGINNWDRSNGGWLERRYNYYSWALSCLKFNQFYEGIELYTDDFGHDLFVEKLKLPYKRVNVKLNQLDGYDPNLWALGKLVTYGLQEEPFLHADGDVFIWGKFRKECHNSPLVVQNLENDFDYYSDIFNELEKEFKHVPISILQHNEFNPRFSGINAGILGGNDIEFIQEYVKIALKFVNENLPYISKINIGLFNNFYEQCLFRILADRSNSKIVPLLNYVNDRFDGLCDLTSVSNSRSYAHAVGIYKKRKETNQLVEYHLKSEFPEYYYRINYLLKNHLI